MSLCKFIRQILACLPACQRVRIVGFCEFCLRARTLMGSAPGTRKLEYQPNHYLLQHGLGAKQQRQRNKRTHTHTRTHERERMHTDKSRGVWYMDMQFQHRYEYAWMSRDVKHVYLDPCGAIVGHRRECWPVERFQQHARLSGTDQCGRNRHLTHAEIRVKTKSSLLSLNTPSSTVFTSSQLKQVYMRVQICKFMNAIASTCLRHDHEGQLHTCMCACALFSCVSLYEEMCIGAGAHQPMHAHIGLRCRVHISLICCVRSLSHLIVLLFNCFVHWFMHLLMYSLIH